MSKRLSTLAIIFLLTFLFATHAYAAPNEESMVIQPPATTEETPKDVEHIVGPYESIYRIAAIYGKDVNEILKANNIEDGASIKKGQKLLIPQTLGPRPNIPLFPTDKWKSITIHHSGTEADSAYTLDTKYLKRGFENGLGSHFVIDNGTESKTMGQIEVGPRWLKQMDAGSCLVLEGKPDASDIFILIVGNYNKDELPENMLDNLVFLTATLMNFYRITPENIIRHDETCPGKIFPWDEFRRRLEEYKSTSKS